MADKDKIDDIVSMLDNFVLNGGGHMNIQVDDSEELDDIMVETYKSTDCASGNMACKIPTLHKGIDD